MVIHGSLLISGLSIVEVELQLCLGVGIRLTEAERFGSWFSMKFGIVAFFLSIL